MRSHCGRTFSFLANAAITVPLEAEEGQSSEVQAGLAEIDAGCGVSHDTVKTWGKSWGER